MSGPVPLIVVQGADVIRSGASLKRDLEETGASIHSVSGSFGHLLRLTFWSNGHVSGILAAVSGSRLRRAVY